MSLNSIIKTGSYKTLSETLGLGNSADTYNIDMNNNDILNCSTVSSSAFIGDGSQITGTTPLAGTQVVSGAYVITSVDNYKIIEASGGSTIDLPLLSSIEVGMKFTFVQIGAGTVVISAQSGELISGTSTRTLTADYMSISLVRDGTGWKILSQYSNIADVRTITASGEISINDDIIIGNSSTPFTLDLFPSVAVLI